MSIPTHRVAGPGGLFKEFRAVPVATVAELQEMAANGVNVNDPAVIQKQVDDALAAAGVSQVDAARQAAKEDANKAPVTREAETELAPET